jgi:hypothetical protein
MRFDIETKASPEQVCRALTDFTPRRLRTWDRTLDPATYQLRQQRPHLGGRTREPPRSPFWVIARYEWSDPAKVRWTIVESSYVGRGEGIVRVRPRGQTG